MNPLGPVLCLVRKAPSFPKLALKALVEMAVLAGKGSLWKEEKGSFFKEVAVAADVVEEERELLPKCVKKSFFCKKDLEEKGMERRRGVDWDSSLASILSGGLRMW